MKCNQNLNLIYNNEYIYQIQKRLYNFEKKSQNETKQQTELLLYQSWSLKKNYFFKYNQYKNSNNKILIYVKLFKEAHFSKKHIENFIYFEFLDSILLFEKMKFTKKYNPKIQIIKFSSFFAQSNFFSIKSFLTNSILLFLINFCTKEKLYYSLIKNYDKELYINFFKLLEKMNKNEQKKFVFFENSSNSHFFCKKIIKRKLKSSKINIIFETKISLQNFYFYFPSEVFNSLGKKTLLNFVNIENFFTNPSKEKLSNFISYLNYIPRKSKKNLNSLNLLETFQKKHFKADPKKFKTISKNPFICLDNSYKLLFFKKLEKSVSLTPICFIYLSKLFHSSSPLTISLPQPFKTYCYYNTSFFLYSRHLKIKNSHSDLFYKLHFINTNIKPNIITLNSICWKSNNFYRYLPLSRSMIRYPIANFLKDLKLNELKNSFRFFCKIVVIKLKHISLLLTLDKYILYLKIKNLLLYLFLLKPKLENTLSETYYFGKKNVSKNEYIAFLVEKLKMNSQYFVQTIFEDCLHFFKSGSNNHEKFFYLQINSCQVKILSKKLEFSSYLFKYLIKNFNPICQSSLFYYTNGKEKNLTFLFFNILINGLGPTLKHSIITKKRKINFLSINFITQTKNISILLKKNSSFISKHTDLNLPQFFYYENQILVLTENPTILSECVNFLKKFLYLQGFIEQFSKLKLGHSLFAYNNNKPGFDFLGFFISQYNQRNNTNLKIQHKQSVEKISLSTAISLNKLRITSITSENKNLFLTNVNPSKKEILIHFEKLKKIIKSSTSITQEHLILKLSSRIRIWSYYYNTSYNNKILNYCDYLVFKLLWRWSCRRHPKKNKKWIKYKYFHQINGKNWIFGIYKSQDFYLLCLPNHSDIRIFNSNLFN
jgi:hypothetical protein